MSCKSDRKWSNLSVWGFQTDVTSEIWWYLGAQVVSMNSSSWWEWGRFCLEKHSVFQDFRTKLSWKEETNIKLSWMCLLSVLQLQMIVISHMALEVGICPYRSEDKWQPYGEWAWQRGVEPQWTMESQWLEAEQTQWTSLQGLWKLWAIHTNSETRNWGKNKVSSFAGWQNDGGQFWWMNWAGWPKFLAPEKPLTSENNTEHVLTICIETCS